MNKKRGVDGKIPAFAGMTTTFFILSFRIYFGLLPYRKSFKNLTSILSSKERKKNKEIKVLFGMGELKTLSGRKDSCICRNDKAPFSHIVIIGLPFFVALLGLVLGSIYEEGKDEGPDNLGTG